MEEFKKWSSFLLPYKFALDELKTKINIMVEEAKYMKDYSMIEHIKTRLKSPKSIISKLERKGFSPVITEAKNHLFDIAGLRIVCSFSSDVYEIYNMLLKRKDIKVLEVKDYIRFPKPNGYQSLHMIIEIPITLSDRVENVYVEIQIRTLAMDFWASLEHKIYYKYNKEIPDHLKIELKDAADTAKLMDEKMRTIRDEVQLLENSKGWLLTPKN
ncbi:GTP pyrophosphokinase family protein [Evansella sp. AB-P1]|uniref:GTP pyrophosphokinase n=1 Tax=Evansella sp. AB-P1 TaxID=3037653 RepID=UPI00241F8F0F|nr:GTP pyrophosphokinase family protein [Evansella sp. AB-P1]MDG5788965.1 GTP pyrophosphokinase family protein [Evansella sp. AB-P1]